FCRLGLLRAPPFHRLSAGPLSLHVAPYGGFTTMLNPRQILGVPPRQDVRFGSKADICSAPTHVCFTPNSDIKCDTWDVRFGPKADITEIYSITSLACASTDDGTVRPSVLAVLRLIASSKLVGVCTGRSLGFSPLSMPSTYPSA